MAHSLGTTDIEEHPRAAGWLYSDPRETRDLAREWPFSSCEAEGPQPPPQPTHMSKQWAAESSHRSAITTAPHLCSFRLSHRLACHGHSPRAAPLPPTILLKAIARLKPQSMREKEGGKRLRVRPSVHAQELGEVPLLQFSYDTL